MKEYLKSLLVPRNVRPFLVGALFTSGVIVISNYVSTMSAIDVCVKIGQLAYGPDSVQIVDPSVIDVPEETQIENEVGVVPIVKH